MATYVLGRNDLMGKSMVKNAVYKILLNMFNIIIPIIVGTYINRVLGPELTGRYSYAFAIFNYFFIFASFGIYNYGLREISRVREDKEKLRNLFTSLFVLGIISNLIIFVIYIFYSMFIINDANLTPVLIILSISIMANIFFVEWANEGLENYGFITIKTIIVRSINVILLFILVRSSKDFYNYVFLMTIYLVLNNIISFIYIRNKIGFNFKNLELKRHIKYLIMVLIMSNVSILYTQLDKVMIGKYMGEVYVGFYTMAQNITNIINTLVMSVVFVTIPRLSNILSKNNDEEYTTLLNRVTKILLIFLFPAAVGIFTLSNEIIYLYGGSKYLAADSVLKAFTFYMVGIGIESILSNQVLYVRKKEKILVIIIFIGGIINLILNKLLVQFGIFNEVTAMITTTISEYILIVSEYIYIKYKLKIKINTFSIDNIKYLIIALLFIPINYIVRLFVLNKIILILILPIVCSFVYILMLVITKDEAFKIIYKKMYEKISKKNVT